MAGVYFSQKNYSKALELHEKAVKIYIDIYGGVHPDIAMSYNNIASVYYSLENYAQAMDYFEKSYDILKELLPAEHQLIKISRNNIEKVKSKISGQ